MDEITKLKARAYDLVAQIQLLQRQLDETNKRIAELIQKSNKANKKQK